MKPNRKAPPNPPPASACPACGIPYTQHPGIISTCAALQRTLGLVRLVLAIHRQKKKPATRKKR